MKEIPLTKGYVAKVDDADYEELSAVSWYAEVAGHAIYACRRDSTLPGRPKQYMHRRLLAATLGELVDHRDHDTLNCQRYNLRKATKAGNSSNRPKMRKATSSQYKGVTLDKRRNRWVAQIEAQGKHRWLGSFLVEADAARAYNDNAKLLFGEFAFLNEIAA